MADKEIISEAPRELSESIKLVLNTKGYGWEIRIHLKDSDTIDIDKEVIERIEKLDEKMRERFGKNDD